MTDIVPSVLRNSATTPTSRLAALTSAQFALHTYTNGTLDRTTSVTARLAGEPARITIYTYDALGNRSTMTSADHVKTASTSDRLIVSHALVRTESTDLLTRDSAQCAESTIRIDDPVDANLAAW